jgi:hypothetical protein
LLAKIYDIHNQSSNAGAPVTKEYKGLLLYFNALRAVVELHKPETPTWCVCDEPYPCPTIQAIEKELK